MKSETILNKGINPRSPFFWKLTLSILCTIAIELQAFSQNDLPPKLKDLNNPFLKDYAMHVDREAGVIYYCGCSLQVGNLFSTFKEYTGLTDDDEMIVVKTWQDELGDDENSPAPYFYHKQYQQYYKGVLVEGASIIEHYDESEEDGQCVFATTGTVTEGLDLSVEPSFGEGDAFGYLTNHLGAIGFFLDSAEEIPQGQLVIRLFQNDDDTIAHISNFKLAYKFDVMAYDDSSMYYRSVYIDANSGDVIAQVSKIHSDGNFNHLYYGNKGDLDTHKKDGNWLHDDKWYLHANDAGRNIFTTDEDNPYKKNKAKAMYDSYWVWDEMQNSEGDDSWGDDHWSATAGHYCTQKAWDFYRDKYNRNGMSGAGYAVRVVADHPSTAGQYLKSDRGIDYIRIGRYNNQYMGTYDAVGHEYTHGVVENSQPLPYEKISGAIDESFGDIFGFMIERYVFGYVRNWTIGEDAYTLRSLSSPSGSGLYDPSYYLEVPEWYSVKSCDPVTGYDFCGVHHNSGVPNKWFYLLSMGGSQSVNGQNRSVTGIGIDKAARIAYYTMVTYTNYDQANVTFDVYRANSLLAAEKLYKRNSPEYISVCRAWWAVNVGSGCFGTPLNPNISDCAWKPDARTQGFELVGLNRLNHNNIKINLTPNPTSSFFTLNIEELFVLNELQDSYEVRILDLNGKLYFEGEFKDINDRVFNIDNFNPGVYIVNIVKGSWVKNIKLVKN